MNNPERIGRLLYSKRRGELTADEDTELTAWRQQSPENEKLFRDKMDPKKLRESMIELYQARDRVFEKIKESFPELANAELSEQDFSEAEGNGKYFRMFPLARRAAIGIAVILGVAVIILLRTTGFMSKHVRGNRDAIYVSPEGIEIMIDDFHRGKLAAEAGIDLRKNEIGEYDYYATSRDRNKESEYTLFSGEGGRFRLILPDSTWVWINSATWIKYPVNFSQDSIHIRVDGEAYFEAKRGSSHTYFISPMSIDPATKRERPSKENHIQIETTSAYFDVNAYSDSSTKLLTVFYGDVLLRPGSVSGKPDSTSRIAAGKQVRVTAGGINILQNVDVNKILARAKWYAGK